MAKQTKLSIRLDETFPGHSQKKFQCPSCSKKRFVRFYDFKENQYLEDQFGRCDRQEHCGYFLSPYSESSEFTPDRTKFIPVPEQKITYVDKKTVSATLSKYNTNTFVQFLIDRVGEQKAMETVYKFYIGTAQNNGTVFWQIDQYQNARTCAKIHYLPDGHRNKDIDVKRMFMLKEGYKPCLFGEHQLFNAPINALFVIVESEKTATLGNCYMNELKNRPLIWLAASGSNGLTFDKIQPLRGKDIVLIPDFSFHARATWGLLPMRKKLKEVNGNMVMSIDEDGELVDYESAKDRLISIGCNVQFFDPYPELKDGSDIADTFVTEKAEAAVVMPNFESFRINNEIPKIKPHTAIEKTARENILTARHGFKLNVLDDGKIEIWMNTTPLQDKIQAFFDDNPILSTLIHKFDLTGGHVSPC